ncbi:MAG: hypothetical protein ACI92O_001439 [Colwellia sp.]|jgi:hypothetical protein
MRARTDNICQALAITSQLLLIVLGKGLLLTMESMLVKDFF